MKRRRTKRALEPLTVLFAAILVLVAARADAQVPKEVRVAYIGIGPTTDLIPDGFLRRAKAAGYTHIQAEYWLHPSTDWSNGRYVGTTFRNGLRDAFIRVHSYGMRLIPEFQSGNQHSWLNTWNQVDNPEIHRESLAYGTPGMTSFCPVYAPDANGFDRSFDELMRVVRDAFNAANLGYALDYINIGHDEPYCNAPGIPTEVLPTCSDGPKLLVGESSEDKAWIWANVNTTGDRGGIKRTGTSPNFVYSGKPTPLGIYRLLASEIKRRVTAVRAVFPSTRVIIYGDIWDPQHWVSRTFNTAGVVDQSDARSVRSALVVMPWQYTHCFDSGSYPTCPAGTDYNPQITFNHLTKNNGFSIMFGSNVANADDPITLSALRAVDQYSAAAGLPEYRKYVIGFGAFPWSAGWDGTKSTYAQVRAFNTLEVLTHQYVFRAASTD